MDRRGFLKTLAGLAALAAVRNSVGDILPAPESFKYTQEAEGPRVLIQDQLFVLDKPYVIDLPYTTILGCTFIARGGWIGPMMEVRGHSTTIMNCMLTDERPAQIVGSAIFVDGRLLKKKETIADALIQLGRAS